MRITQHKSKHDKDVSLDGYNEESGLLKVSTRYDINVYYVTNNLVHIYLMVTVYQL